MRRLILALALALGGCASTGPISLDDPAALESDPIEPVNRGVFWVNDRLDVFVLEPIAKGWDFIAPETVEVHLDQFFTNLRFPVRFVGTLLQGKVRASGEELGRFGVNTTVGLLGFFDPATGWGLERHDEDFGQALGRWGTPPGPYLMLPLLGPSNTRDAVGRLVDTFLGSGPALISPGVNAASTGVDLINSRSLLLEDIREAKAASLDYYAFVRNVYLQRREALVRDEEIRSEDPIDDLYEIEEDLEDDR